MEKFNYSPNRSFYTARDGQKVLGTQLDGGLSRYRQDQVNAAHTVQCQWVLETERDFRLWRNFYLGVARSGAVRFLMDLVIDDEEPVEYTCNFIPGTYSLDSIQGPIHMVSSQIEVKPNIVDLDYYASVWMLDNQYGSLEEADIVLNLLDQFVNVDLPGAFGDLP